MSTIKSSSEDLTLNADGLGKDIKFQSNGVEKASLTDAGVLTATSFAGDGSNLTGLPAAGDRSDFVLLATKTGGAGTYDFASGDGVDHSIYSTYTFELSGVYPSTNDQVLWMRTSDDDGSTYASATYLARLHSIDQAGLHEISGSSGTAVAIILTTTGVRTGATQGGCSGTVKIPGQAAGNKVYTTSLLGWQQPTGADYLVGIASGNYNGAFPDSGGIDAYRFMFASGNINGTIKMYGAK